MKNMIGNVVILIHIVLISILNISVANAAKYVKIAVINELPRINKDQDQQKVVDQVKEFWKIQLSKVITNKPDLIVLPEACDRPVGMSREEQFDYYNVRKDQVMELFASVAKLNHCYIAFGSKGQAKNGSWYNSLIVLDRTGKIAGVYNKNFPTIGELESGIKGTEEAPIIKCDFGTIVGAVCYDLNFPELLAKYQKAKPDIILFSSMYHGGLVQSYWAYSCRAFFVGSIADKGVPSEIRNPLGEVIANTTNYFNHVVADVNLDRRLVHLDFNWEKLVKLKEKYGDEVTIKDPGKLGSVLVTSESKTKTVDQMLKEFDIELLDDYFERSREVRFKTSF